MEITQSSKNPVEPPTVEVGTSRRGAVATRPGILQLRASGDASAVHQDFSKNSSGKRQRYKKRSRTKSDGSESLSDIDDSEIVGYLNNKKEMHLKRMLWEAMNKDHVKVKKQKTATETKETTSARKAVKTIEKLEQQKRSSRINYDALRLLNDDMEQGSGTAHNIDLKLDSWRNDYSQNESITTYKIQKSEEGNYDEDEDQQQIICGEDDFIYSHHNEAMPYGYEDEYNENFDFED
ncbi:Hypothetical predicted protein [Olea europaea subsp. europaea]|uniref:Brf1 TBP-binding domain-containing protein n=1 Tax=Olea europaea subsp. europaea TaxID=158383 RepID=A0A8S0Q390_OLEEU|nr:Hypothetical predicted protein [Olea europaea subsp. europaea]